MRMPEGVCRGPVAGSVRGPKGRHDRAEPLDPVGRRIVLANLSLIAAAYCSFVVWRIMQAMQSN